MKYRFCDQNKSPLLGSESLIYIDGRLNTENIKTVARDKANKLIKFKPFLRIEYITPFLLRSESNIFIKLR